MKLTVFILFLSLMQVSATVYSQATQFSFMAQNKQVVDVLRQIEENSNFRFFFLREQVDVERRVTVTAREATVEQILEELFKDQPVSYEFANEALIVLTHNDNPLGSIKEYMNIQQRTVSGTVTDESGEPLPGVTVVVKGTMQGTVTNADGEYTLANIPEDATLVFSFVGMLTKEIEVGDQTTIDVTMVVDAIGIEEVVAIGYGVVKKSDLTGSVGTMKAEELAKQPVASVDQALQGRISGVQVTNTSGAPGSNMSIRIRGGNSINAGNEPLYVIDGFIGAGNLNTLNPNDIESIEVLKDASSTAIYGSRGSNGVILITTKRGTGTKGSGISFDTYYGIQQPTKKIDVLNGPEFAEYANEFATFNGFQVPFPDGAKIANTDYQDLLFRTVPINNNNLSMYGNSERNNYYVSLNYLDQPGIQIGSSFKRYQIKTNVDQKIGDFLEAGASLTAAYTNRENPRARAFKDRNIPTAPIYNEDGTFFSIDQINGGTYNNPVAEDELIMDNTYTYNVLGNSYLQLNLFEGLSFKSTIGIDFIISKRNRYVSGQIPTNFEAEKGGEAIINTQFSKSLLNENTLNYLKRIGDHSFTFVSGWTYQNYNREGLIASASGFTNDVTTYNAIETGDPAQLRTSSTETKWTLFSGLYRLNYSFQGKYLLTISNRHDGSSRLADGKKWQMFPSAAVAWRVSEEDFMQESKLISNLKLRVSYGKTGSQSVAPYETLSKLQSGFNYLGDKQVVTMYPGLAASSNLTWEKTDQYDIGINLGLLNNRLNFEADVYYKKTTDLLLARELSFQTGFESRLENVGALSNKGFDINLNGDVIRNNDFTWFSSLIVSSNKNEVLELSGGKTFIENGQGSRIIVGEPVGIFYGVKYLGVWQEDDPELGTNVPGAPKWEEVEEDGIIDQNDGQIIGNAIPLFYGGLNNVFSYKNFSVSMFFDFSYGNDIYDLDGGNYNTGHNTNVYGKFRDRWTPENRDTNIPKAGAQYFGGFLYGNYAASSAGKGNDFFVSDGSFFRLKNINMQYDIPIKSKIIKKLNFYGSATNLFTITKYEGFSPDVNSEGTHSTRRGFDQNTYPPARLITIGIKADF